MDNAQNDQLEVEPVDKEGIFARIFVQAIFLGGVAGAVSGMVFCCLTAGLYSIFSWLLGIPIGAAVGLGLGAINGIVGGIETIFFFDPIKGQRAYRWRVFWLGLTVSYMVAAPLVRVYSDGLTTFPALVFYVLIAASTFWASGKICKWNSRLWTATPSPSPTLD